MKTILCYGDSNTWGYNGEAGPPRYGLHGRWPGVLRDELGEGYYVIEEGLPGRTTIFDDPCEDGRNGLLYLRPCLESHNPDIVLILLGTNDLKKCFNASAWDIAQGAAKLARLARSMPVTPSYSAPEVCLVAPPPVLEIGPYSTSFEGAARKSREFPELFRQAAQDSGVRFFDASLVAAPSPTEGLHWREEEHRKLGKALAKFVRETFPDS